MRWDIFDECRYNRQGVGRVGCGVGWRCDRHAVMEMRGRNRKWLGTGNRRTVGEVGLVVLLKFCTGVGECGRKGSTFIVVDIDELGGQHEHVRGEYRSGNRRRPVNREEGANGRKLAVDFFFLDIEKVSDMFNHLLVGESHLVASRTIQRGRGDNIGGVASAVNGRGQAGRNEDGGGQVGHCWDGWTIVWCIESKKQVCMVDAKGAVDQRSCCEVLKSQDEVGMRIV